MSVGRVADVGKILAASQMSISSAVEGIRNLMVDGVEYQINFDDLDGQILRRFSRALPYEAWIIAKPVDDEGSVRRDVEVIVAAIQIDPVPLIGAAVSPTMEHVMRQQLSVAISTTPEEVLK